MFFLGLLTVHHFIAHQTQTIRQLTQIDFGDRLIRFQRLHPLNDLFEDIVVIDTGGRRVRIHLQGRRIHGCRTILLL